MSSTKHLEGTWCSGDLPFLITNGVRNGQRELWKLMLDLPCLRVLSPAIGSLSLSPFWMKSTHMPISQKLFVTLKNSAQMETERRRRRKKKPSLAVLGPLLNLHAAHHPPLPGCAQLPLPTRSAPVSCVSIRASVSRPSHSQLLEAA